MSIGMTWGEGAEIAGTPFRLAVAGTETDGHAVVLTVDMPPGLHVPSHVHHTEDQLNIVIAGRVHFRVGDDETELGAGGILLMPRNIPHELWNPTDDVAQIVEIYTPPGMEQKFIAAGAGAAQRGDQAAHGDYAAVR